MSGGQAFQAEVTRDVVEATGPDTATFLQGQLSQDVAGLAVGASTYSLLLQPQGKVDAWVRVTRRAEDAFLLDVDGGWGEAVRTRLNRFRLRTRCELTLADGWTCWAVRGVAASAVPVDAGDGAVVIGVVWPTVEGFDRLGPALRPLDGVPVGDAERYESTRVAAGVPAMGSELDESTIPAEAGRWLIDTSVSFTKGCYTGQELVARVDSRGANTPRRLRRVRVGGGGGGALRAGAVLELDGSAVGTVTSAAEGGRIGLAYLKRAVAVPATVAMRLSVGGDAVEVEVLALPSEG